MTDPAPQSGPRGRHLRRTPAGAARLPNVPDASPLLGLKDTMQLAPPAADTAGSAESLSLADVVERLLVEFEPQLPLPAIYAIVRRCRRELDTQPNPARPELVERLARERLGELASGTTATSTGEDTPRLP